MITQAYLGTYVYPQAWCHSWQISSKHFCTWLWKLFLILVFYGTTTWSNSILFSKCPTSVISWIGSSWQCWDLRMRNSFGMSISTRLAQELSFECEQGGVVSHIISRLVFWVILNSKRAKNWSSQNVQHQNFKKSTMLSAFPKTGLIPYKPNMVLNKITCIAENAKESISIIYLIKPYI